MVSAMRKENSICNNPTYSPEKNFGLESPAKGSMEPVGLTTPRSKNFFNGTVDSPCGHVITPKSQPASGSTDTFRSKKSQDKMLPVTPQQTQFPESKLYNPSFTKTESFPANESRGMQDELNNRVLGSNININPDDIAKKLFGIR